MKSIEIDEKHADLKEYVKATLNFNEDGECTYTVQTNGKMSLFDTWTLDKYLIERGAEKGDNIIIKIKENE